MGKETYAVELSPGMAITIASILMVLIISFYILRSIGLYTLAKRQNISNRFLAYIPFVWIYIACKLVKESRIFGTTIGKLAVWITVIFATLNLFDFLSKLFTFFPVSMFFLQGGEVIFDITNNNIIPSSGGLQFNNLFDTPFINTLLTIFSITNIFYMIMEVLIAIAVYFPLFRKFWPQNHILAGFMSILGLFAPFVFAIRKKDPVNYADYMRARYYGTYGNPYANRQGTNYQNQNGFNNPNNADSPFSEFDDKKEDPFSEFDNKK